MTVSIIVQKFDQNAQQRVSEVPKKKPKFSSGTMPLGPPGESNHIWNLI